MSHDPLQALPQQGPMRLLSRVIELQPGLAVAQVDIEASSAFAVPPRGVPGWVALEYLGQTCALIGLADAARRAAAGQDEDGFLLGSRELDFAIGEFAFGSVLTVRCQTHGELGGSLASFRGEVLDAHGDRLAAGRLSVVRVPRMPAGFTA